MRIVLRNLGAFLVAMVLLGPARQPCLAQAAAPQPEGAQAAQQTPAAQAYTLPPDKLAKAVALNRIRNILDIAAGLWGIAVAWLLLATRLAAALEAWATRIFTRRWQQGLVFFAALVAMLTLANLPLDLYGHHVSRAYGISIEGWASWLGEQGKALALSVVVGALVLLLFNWIVRRWPRRYWLGAWLLTLPLLLASAFVEPLIEPLFNHYEPLAQQHAELVAKLEKLVARTGTSIPPARMLLMKASQKTNGLNAYVTGIGATKRLVIWDTTAARMTDDEVLFTVGHETGHYVLNHIPKGLALSAAGAFFVFWICAGSGAWMARRNGARWGLNASDPDAPALATRAGFVVLIFAVTIAGFVLEPVTNTVSRYFEHQADVYGQEAIHGLVPDPQKTAVATFQTLGEAWLEDPDPSPLVEFWEYNHPSVKTRANFAAHYNPWANGGHGEFFDK